MPVGVMHVGHVRVPVAQSDMPVRVRVRFALGIAGTVHVPVMFVVDMSVDMLQRFMLMLVFVAFGQVKPDADRHEQPAGDQGNRHRLAQ